MDKQNRCCGNCKHFKNVDEYGYGVCEKENRIDPSRENKGCDLHSISNGWTEITPDNVDEVRKNNKNIIVMHPKEWKAPEIACLITEENLFYFSKYGGYYYYVLPELKIE